MVGKGFDGHMTLKLAAGKDLGGQVCIFVIVFHRNFFLANN